MVYQCTIMSVYLCLIELVRKLFLLRFNLEHAWILTKELTIFLIFLKKVFGSWGKEVTKNSSCHIYYILPHFHFIHFISFIQRHFLKSIIVWSNSNHKYVILLYRIFFWSVCNIVGERMMKRSSSRWK